MFNSSFPASLVAYMGSKGVDPVFICTDKDNAIVHKSISAAELLGIDPLSENSYYDYEAGYFPYEQYYTADNKEKIDLVMIDRSANSPLSGLEVKLTTLPDSTTKDLPDAEVRLSCVLLRFFSSPAAFVPAMILKQGKISCTHF